jgi:tetratricopeptide (TPR) repeat protein
MPKRRVPITAGIGLLLGASLCAATIGRSKVNFSAYGSYDECKRGYDAMKAGHNQEALRWLQSAAAYHYNQAPCFTSLGYVSHSLDRFTESVDAYRRAAKMGDEDSEFYLGELYEKGEAGLLKDPQQAVEWYRKAAEHGSPEILNNVAWAMETSSDPSIRDIPAALGYAHKAVNADKDHPKPYILDTLAYAYFLNQQFEEAITTEQRASELAGSEEKKEYLAKIKIYQLSLKVEKKLPKRDKELAKGD